MKTLVNKANPQIRITAPEVEVYDKYYYIRNARLGILRECWTLVEEEETIVETIKEFIKKGERCEQQAVEDNDQENYIFWGGFRNCAENILREVEEPAEGIKGNLEEVPSNVDLEEAAEDFVWEVMENDENGISELSRKLRPSSKISDYYDALAEFFKAGAKWAIEQLKEK